MSLFNNRLLWVTKIFSLAIVVGLTGCAARDGYAPVWSSSAKGEAFKKNNEGRKSYYVVKPGDTLYSIGFMYKLDYRNLARWNNIIPPYKLEEGDRLRLYTYTPSHPKPLEENKQVVTAVIEKSGSSYQISKIEKVALDRLKEQKAKKEAAQVVSIEQDSSSYTISEVERLALKRLKNQERKKEEERVRKGTVQVESQKSDTPLIVAKADLSKEKVEVKHEVNGVTSGENRGSSQKLSGVERPASQIKPTPEKAKEKVIKSVWQWPIDGEIIKNFPQTDKMGIEIGGEAGQKVKASAAGKIVYSGPSGNKYGNLLIIKHNDSHISAYAHNHKLLVKEGVVVNQGQVIAEIGSGVGQRGALLHFEIRKDGKSVNPLRYLPKR